MNKELIVRAWKEPSFRASLSPEERAALPECPSGKPMTELDETELDGVLGGLVPVKGGAPTGCDDGSPTCGIVNCTTLGGAGESL